MRAGDEVVTNRLCGDRQIVHQFRGDERVWSWYRDDFQRPDSDALGSEWITSDPSPHVQSGRVFSPWRNRQTFWATGLHRQTLATDHQSVKVEVGPPGGEQLSPEPSGLALRVSPVWGAGTHAELFFTVGGLCSIASTLNGSSTIRVTSPLRVGYGAHLEFRAVGNVYSGHVDGSPNPFISWTDVFGVVDVGPTYRGFGFYVGTHWTGRASQYTPAIEWIEGKDI